MQKGSCTSGSPKDVLTLLPRGKSGSCGLSLAQTSTSLLSPKKTKEKIWSCHSPCSHKRHSKSWPWAHFCDAKHKLMSRSLHQIRDLSDFLYITHANSGQTQILRGSCERTLPNLSTADEQQPMQTTRSFQEPQRGMSWQ